jgi:hypothetical protein
MIGEQRRISEGHEPAEAAAEDDRLAQPERIAQPAQVIGPGPQVPELGTAAIAATSAATSRILLTTDASAGFDQLSGIRSELLTLP